ncbi:hypothetical protein HGRIS_000580 [Hohenbuehelia grisea]|uniref:Uncharacterized protein n=1 Tax=Hohenbuehelia grisea TaxID=104357 RepID=A0ABR3JRM1_9AGAR
MYVARSSSRHIHANYDYFLVIKPICELRRQSQIVTWPPIEHHPPLYQPSGDTSSHSISLNGTVLMLPFLRNEARVEIFLNLFEHVEAYVLPLPVSLSSCKVSKSRMTG